MIALVFALDVESDGIHPSLCSCIWNLGVTGSRAASALDCRLDKIKPRAIIHAGFAGGLQSALNVGSIVIGENYSSPHILQFIQGTDGFHFGSILTSNDIVETSDNKRALGIHTGSQCVDCESSHVFEVCKARGIPSIAVRSISDTVRQCLPIPGRILISARTGAPDGFMIFKYLIARPSKIPKMAALVRDSQIARKSLNLAIHEILHRLLRFAPLAC